MHKSWRDCKAWQDEGLTMSTTSNEACKMFDAGVTQYTTWKNIETLGGLENTLKAMLEADPEFVMGHVLSTGLDLMGSGKTILQDNELKKGIEELQILAQRDGVTAREKKHAKAIHHWALGNLEEAGDIWESILTDHPTDMVAIKMSHDTFFFLGEQIIMRDTIAGIMPAWKKETPLYSYLYGMHAFGLVETNLYAQAEAAGKKGLELNKNDAWATHALAHVYEVEGRQDDGIKLMNATEDNWNICDMLACHNYWHLALYHVENSNYEGALHIFDQEVARRVQSGAMLDFVDGASLLYRLELERINVGNRWNKLISICKQHLNDHILSFNDAHFMMVCLGNNDSEAANHLLASLKEFISGVGSSSQCIAKTVGLPLCNALQLYADQKYDDVVALLAPQRSKIIQIGGSNPQRDVFHQVLIHACCQSNNINNQQLGRRLLWERKAMKENSPLTDRLIARYMASHHN